MVKVLTIAEAARQASVSYDTLSRAIKAKELPVVRRGRLVRVLSQDVDAWLLSHRNY